MLELLTEKFNLFNGVFGASDDVLGSIESGVDFEKRILSIYQECRTPDEIETAFKALQAEMDERIQARMSDTRKMLLENFDEDVHERLRIQLLDAKAQLDRFSKRFWSLTEFMLQAQAQFDDAALAFDLAKPPTKNIPAGRYHLISKSAPDSVAKSEADFGAFLYRLSHPLGEYVIDHAKALETPTAKVVFNISRHPTRLHLIESLRGKHGYLVLNRLAIESYEREEHLLFSALDEQGLPVEQETCEKLFNCMAENAGATSIPDAISQRLTAESERHARATISQSLEANNQHFNEAREKLEKWADDLVLAAEKALKDTKEQIKLLQRQANRKDNDKERRFVLIEPHTHTFIDESGDEYQEELSPVEEINGELVIRFDYKVMPKGSKQDALVHDAVAKVLGSPIVKDHWLDLNKREPTESNPQRTLLEKCLTSYTTKNSADYFIHKDLGDFLRRELDFYIKNEVMHLDDVQGAEHFANIEKSLRLIQTLRAISLDLIAFLAQLEDFQKQLWLKKKFVVATNYSVTLDRIPESLYPKIAANQKQWDQWDDLGMLDGKKSDLFSQANHGSVEYLKAHQYLMADTSLFDSSFKHLLLGAIDNLEDSVDGLLIHGDNFQALNLLLERFRGEVTCIYIDPPYNTDAGPITYKNGYRSSSWISMMDSRLEISRSFLNDDGIREKLLSAYSRTCAVTGCSIVELLEAAHIQPHAEEPNYSVTNGLLVRADIHTLFDINLLSVDSRLRIRLAPSLLKSEYKEFEGKLLKEPATVSEMPSSFALDKRYQEFKRVNKI